MARYIRLRLEDGRSVLLRVQGETPQFLSGILVNREGDEVPGEHGEDEQLHVIEKAAIVRQVEMEFDRHYGWLVAAKGSTGPQAPSRRG